MGVAEVLVAEPLLEADEVRVLAGQIEAGLLAREARTSGRGFADATEVELRLLEELGEQARQRFIRANLRLVAMVAQHSAQRSRLSDGDLFQEGCLGLITAVERFDHRRGYRFSTYGLFWIRAYVNAATARQLGAVNLPTSRAEQLRVARGAQAELAQQLGRAASVAEVAAALGRTPAWTATLLAHEQPQSIELLDGSALDRLGQVDELDGVLGHQLRIEDLLGALDPLSRRVLEVRLGLTTGEPCSLAEVGRVLGISVTRVRRIEARALETLRGVCPQQASVHLGGAV